MVEFTRQINKGGILMAIKVTNKKPKSMNRRSHALNKTNHFQKPNMITITVNGVKIKTSAREARTILKAN